jgi:linoleate 8R-lipoxygenase / 9,12-octadecadienoate 8-hydroperoxide 8R-isomerase
VVEQLALIDENGRFSSIRRPLGKFTPEEIEKRYDNALFQTGRLITGGLYIQIILKDYVRTILNLNRTDSKWDLDPRSADGKALFGEGAGEAVGNQVSAEFNLIYRWHSCVSKKDEEWTNNVYQQMFPGAQSRSLADIVKRLSDFGKNVPRDPHERRFANLTRTKSGSYEDEHLASIFAASVEDVAGAFGANQVPEVLRDVEILGIMQARSWKLASLNEFRKFFKLIPHKTFEDINPNPYVAEQLKRLYDHPDFVELYPGLVVEDAKYPVTPGSGLCPGYTISRAVLSDAVALVRGDRFYTVDYTPKNLTNWGFTEADSDLTVDNGHVFYKLVLRALPGHFRQNSIYAHYPLVVPEENRIILGSLNTAQYYSFEKPCAAPEMSIIGSYAACKAILRNQRDYKVTWGMDAIDFLMELGAENYGQNFMLSGDGLQNAKSRQLMGPALYPGATSAGQPKSWYPSCLSSGRWIQEVKSFYEDITLRLLHQNSYQIAGVNQVDIVRDVSNIAQVHFASSVFSLPLKTNQNPHGIYSGKLRPQRPSNYSIPNHHR